jgi:hypothetical protein
MCFSKDADEEVAVWLVIHFFMHVTHEFKPLPLTSIVISDRMLVSESGLAHGLVCHVLVCVLTVFGEWK